MSFSFLGMTRLLSTVFPNLLTKVGGSLSFISISRGGQPLLISSRAGLMLETAQPGINSGRPVV
jgi:hypothetical protein